MTMAGTTSLLGISIGPIRMDENTFFNINNLLVVLARVCFLAKEV
jgi:hypothetical protein